MNLKSFENMSLKILQKKTYWEPKSYKASLKWKKKWLLVYTGT
jgi:hypothetical protein